MTAFAGTPFDSLFSLQGPGESVLLSGASIDAPSFQTIDFLAENVRAAGLSRVNQQPFVAHRAGADAPAFGYLLFDHIHVEPRVLNLGFVLSEVNFSVEVWNAYMSRAHVLTNIAIAGPAGLEIVDPPDLPTHFAGSQSIVYQIKAETQGSPFINNVITWTFTGFDPAGTDLTLTGTRLVPFPFSPNWQSPVSEGIGSLNDLQVSYDDTEQRILLKSLPTRRLKYEALCLDERESQILDADIFGWQPRPYGVPYWQDETELLAPIAPGATAATCNTVGCRFEAGGLAMIWTSPSIWEVMTILTIADSGLTFTSATRYAWATNGAFVVPMRLGRLTDSEEVQRESQQFSSFQVSFDIEASK